MLLLAFLSITSADDIQRLNGLKNVLVVIVNGVAAVLFMMSGDVDYPAAAAIGFGAIVGGQVGAHIGRRLPNQVLRGALVCVGVTVSVWMLLD